MRRLQKPLSWLLGIAGVALVVWYFGPANVPRMLQEVGVSGILQWALITVIARVFLAETTTAPLRTLGFSLRRRDAFWIGWLRTFANQVIPAAGVVAYVQAIRSKTTISWSEVAALAAPQFVLVAAALGLVGLVAVFYNIEALETSRYLPLIALYSATIVAALLVWQRAHALISLLPQSIAVRVATTSDALRKMAQRPTLVLLVIACHVSAILLRGLRMWLLFEAAGIHLELQQMILIVAVAESSMLIQLTPGGLGVREGAVLAGAMLVGVPTEAAAGVALLDRLFVILITTLLTPPAILVLRSSSREA
jgi:uncharacterized protein (TIRG00374 family)